jgi:sulfide:quinone oxidoreductase
MASLRDSPAMGSRTHVVILGAGFAGLELATRLSDDVGDLVDVTVIDQSDAFVFGFTKLDVMFGRRTLDEVRLPYRLIDKPSVELRQETVLTIDPVGKRVVTSGGTYDADVLVIALGADLAPDATPGFVEGGFEFYSPEGADRVRGLLPDFAGGAVVIAVLGGFFKCPPAPYETAFMLHDYLTERGVRSDTTITLVTPMPKPIPISDDVSAAILASMDERGIEYSHGTSPTAVDPAAKTVQLRDGRALPFDLLLGVPVHVAPPVVVDAGLTDEGWIAVDIATFATKFADVFAVGDITSAPVPRAGVIAEGEATTLADVLVDRVRGGAPVRPFAGAIKCYIEMGHDQVGLVDVNFLSGPTPVAAFTPPTRDGAEQKRQFAATRRQRWFGQP